MTPKTSEINFRDIPVEISSRITRQLMQNEIPQVICYNRVRYRYYILTDKRIMDVYVLSKNDIRITTMFLNDVDQIEDYSSGSFYGYKIIKLGKTIMTIIIDNANELAVEFGNKLYQSFNEAKYSH